MIGFECFQQIADLSLLAKEMLFVTQTGKAIVGLRPVIFGPRTLMRTWGTRPEICPGIWVRRYSGAFGCE
jgi:hypothetical protein